MIIVTALLPFLCGDIAFFCDFHDGGGGHLGFLKIPNFNGLSALRGQFASLYHISSKSAKILPRYGDLMDFKKWRPSTISD